MKDFDLNKIGKEMPYKAPDKDFFENFTNDLLAKTTERQTTRVFSLRRTLTPIITVAAAIAVVVTVGLNLSKVSQGESVDLLSANVDNMLDSYFESLSDEELAYLATYSSYSDDFYSNLPTE